MVNSHENGFELNIAKHNGALEKEMTDSSCSLYEPIWSVDWDTD